MNDETRQAIKVQNTVYLDELVEALATLPRERAFRFMKDLDERICDLSFTEKLAQHFSGIVRKERKSERRKTKRSKRPNHANL